MSRAEEPFQELKIAMTSAPVFALSDFVETFILEADACSTR